MALSRRKPKARRPTNPRPAALKGRAAGPRPAQRYGPSRLGALYEISKLLTHFVETTEQTVLTLLAIVTKDLPLRSVILTEKTASEPKAIVWHKPGLPLLDGAAAEARALKSFSYLIGAATASSTPEPRDSKSEKRGRFLTLPLSVQGRSIFGALHLEGVSPFNESDLEFVSAIANQLAISLARYHAHLAEIALRETAESSARRAEREVAGRRRVEEEIRKLNADLERRVAERTAQFQDTIKELHAFTYSIAHDLRAPLRHINGFSHMLLTSADDEACNNYARRIMKSSESMDRLIQDLLAYSQLTLAEVRLAPASLDALVGRVAQALDEDLKESKAELILDAGLPAVLAHEASLSQAITNLLSNALKFAAPGVLPRVRVRAERRGGRVRLWVEDNGIGIDPAHQEKIFGVFQRLHRSDEYPGTGIGLAIVRRAMERMHGGAGVESAPGTGSRFWLELEAAPEAP